METTTIAWIAFGVYLAVTTALAFIGMRKTKDMSGFALGNGDMGPLLVGITLAAAVASTATFVINPGFVWASGLSALLHFGVAGAGGVTIGLIVLSKGFRRLGKKNAALTLPHWLGGRYESPGMRTYFALLNLVLAISFVVLIIKGSAFVMEMTLFGELPGVDQPNYLISVVIIVAFVFSYILMGGTYAHAYTNALQGAMMVGVALLLLFSGAHLWGDDIFGQLAAQNPNLATVVNPTYPLFDSYGEVFLCGFIISFGLVCQPHILMKSLYLKSDRDVNMYLIIAAVVGAIFASILLVGIYARIEMPELAITQDAVMASYIAHAFEAYPVVGVLISVALLAAGMSTMDGILVSASTIAGSDLFLGAFGERLAPGKSDEERSVLALKASRYILVAMGLVSFLIAIDPPKLVGIFAQAGIYGLVAASLAPVTFGIFVEKVPRSWAFASAVIGPIVHFAHYVPIFIMHTLDPETVELINPAVTGTEGVVVSVTVLALGVYLERRKATSPATKLTSGETPPVLL